MKFSPMLVSLSGTRRWLFLVLCLLQLALLFLVAGRMWLAEIWANSHSPESWERAAELEPDNAEHWRLLGRYRQWDFANADLPRAIGYLERAVAADPSSAFLRMDLASAYEMQGDTRRAQAAYEEAKRLYPISADVAWSYGNFLLRAGQSDAAFAEIRRAIEQNPSLTPLAVSVCWRAGATLDQILGILPARTNTYLHAVELLLAEKQFDAGMRVWERLESLHEPLDPARPLAFTDVLLRAGRVEDASRVWQHTVRTAGWNGKAENSLVWDGGFELDSPRSGFGWRLAEVPGVRIDFDTTEHFAGARSLRLQFEGSTNVDLSWPVQFVAVEPSTHYRFSAQLKLDGITTDKGIHFRIFDSLDPRALDLETPDRIGSLPWIPQTVEFTTGPQTRLLQILLRRSTSAKFDNKIQGTVWVDEVTLTPLPGAGR